MSASLSASVPYFVASAIAAAFGFLTPLRGRASVSSIFFQAATVLGAAWFLCFGMMTVTDDPDGALLWARFGSVAAVIIPGTLYEFTILALGIKVRRRVASILIWSFTAIGALLASSDLLIRSVWQFAGGFRPRAGVAAPYVLVGVTVVLLAPLVEYWRQFKFAFVPAQRDRMRVWMIAFAIPPLVLVDALSAFGLRIYPAGYLFVILFLLLATVVFRKHWLASITPSFAAREIVQTMADGVVVCDAAGRIQVVNRALLSLTGYTEQQLTGQFLHLFLDPDATLADSIRLKQVLAGEKVPDRETVFRNRTGGTIDVSLSIAPIGELGATAGAVLIVRDIRERKTTEESLRDSEERYRQFVERNLAGVFRMTPEGEILDANDALARIFGSPSGKTMVGTNVRQFYETPEAFDAAMKELRTSGSLTGQELRLRREDGSTVWVLENVSMVAGRKAAEGTMIDITDRKIATQKIEFQAFHDPLTALPNRKLFIDRLTMAIAQSRRSAKSLGVIFVDLDRFKLINDTFGHAGGDRVLITVAERISKMLRASDTVARVGGDELAVLLTELRDPSDAGVVAQKIIRTFDEPAVIDTRAVNVTASLGVALFPVDGDDPDSLLKNADGAMYRAKQSGRNNFQLCTPEMKQSALERIDLEQKLRGALLRDELILYYQPMIDLAESRVCGVEALLRWKHPDRGLLAPDAFIGIAEDTNLIIPIGRWVIRTALTQMKRWHRSGLTGLRLALNLSPRQFQQPDVGGMLAELLEQSGVEPSCLELEITESTAMANLAEATKMLKRLRRQGIKVAIDDFGIGYSSLNYLHQLPIDSVKIDRSFIQALGEKEANFAIVDAVIAIARSLKLRVVAEGVETKKQLGELTARGCHEAQGYLFSRPVLPAEIAPFIRSWNRPKKSRKSTRKPRPVRKSRKRSV